jgi:iron complex outermembrane receptor protein
MTHSSFTLTVALAALLLLPMSASAQGETSKSYATAKTDSILKTVQLLPATVSAIQAPERSPFPTQAVEALELAKRDASMDMPLLLRFTPSLVVTSDAGAGIGYTSMRIRGSDQTHINVTINGVALNDAESHQVYWVDLPDLASSVDNLNIQRGVGSSSNGAGAFGATVAIQTMEFNEKAGGRVLLSGGSFGTLRSMAQWSTGEIGSGFFMEGRASRILSKGYMDRSGSDLSSMQLGFGYRWDSGQIAYSAMLGHERTEQAWFGVPRIGLDAPADSIRAWAANSYEYGYGADTARIEDLIARGRQHNYYDYADQVDDYRQDHHQIHVGERIGGWDLGATLHYTAGAGYWEQYREADSIALYGGASVVMAEDTVMTSNVIRRRWLDNDYLGGIFQGSRANENSGIQFGLGAFQYAGEHFGNPIWMEAGGDSISPQHRYYDNLGEKFDRYAFVSGDQRLAGGKVNVRGEIQVRQVDYTVEGTDNDLRTLQVDTSMTFINPKFGLDYIVSPSSRVFASVARGSREPVRNDFIDRVTVTYPKAEQLTDFELGWEISTPEWSMQAVGYYMQYENQLVLTGALNDVGSSIRQNVTSSYRAGLEWTNIWRPRNGFQWYSTVTASQNRITEFGFDLGMEPADISFSPNLTASSVVTWEALNRLNGEGVGSTCLIEWSARHVGKQYLDNTSSDVRSLDAYNVHDARIRWMWNRPNGSYISVSGYLRNFLDSQYSANGWTYFYESGGEEISEVYVYPQAGRHGLVALEFSF